MSPKLPRNLSGQQLIKLLSNYGYNVTRQKGSHIRITRVSDTAEHHLTIPNHNPLRLGTLNSIISDAAEHLNISKDEILNSL
jgi:predicted RNA binding protein YcfA (HicA-like mRNA interferase family)